MNFYSAGTAICHGWSHELLSRGPKIQGSWWPRGTPTTWTKSLDLHHYHNCHRSTLGVWTLPSTPCPPPPL